MKEIKVRHSFSLIQGLIFRYFIFLLCKIGSGSLPGKGLDLGSLRLSYEGEGGEFLFVATAEGFNSAVPYIS